MILQAAGPGVDLLVAPNGPSSEVTLGHAEVSDRTTVVPARAIPTLIDPSTRRRSR